MMYDELVKRLRSEAVYLPEKFSKNAELLDVLIKAADAIEDMNRSIVGIEADNESLCEQINEAHNKGYADGYWAGRRDYESKWIPVTERLPEDGAEVLAWSESGFSYVDWWIDGKWKVCGLVDGKYEHVTHWMPLPEPPEKEKT